MSSIEVCFILDLLKILIKWLSILPIAGGRIIPVFHKCRTLADIKEEAEKGDRLDRGIY
ncbi:hypothetical protein [Lacrimispora celerecrescens]|uniref:Uncharacterized protein n=1 Tax=[Clostridium] celerecrescens 18A TaxID=1286362 RepID=A0A2M8Z5H3_9FIRM|nr:hypothetical protein [Lacrimispora celerecrescens]PJJ28692.1 hypothetical protein H171_2211 [[Clostridium] celerecrescens 18A]